MLFEGARLITGDGSAPIENGAFVVADGRFVSVGAAGQFDAPLGVRRIDPSGKTVIPAFIDAVYLGGGSVDRTGEANSRVS